MYCIYCGKKLEDGEICSCQQKKQKKGGMLSTILGWFFLLLGVGVFVYLYFVNKEFLQEIEIPFLKEYMGYLVFVLPALLVLISLIFAVKGIIAGRIRGIAGILMFVGLIGIIALGVLFGLKFSKLHHAVQTISTNLNSQSMERVMEIYEEAWDGEKELMQTKLQQQVDQVYADYQAEKITYEEAIEKVDSMEKADLVEFNAAELRTKLTALQVSRSAFAEASELEGKADYQAAIAKYELVIEEDEDYQAAAERIKLCEEALYQDLKMKAAEYADGGDYKNAIEVLEEAKAYTDNVEEADQLIESYRDLEAEGGISLLQSGITEENREQIQAAYALADEEGQAEFYALLTGKLSTVESAFAKEEITYEEALTEVEANRSLGILSEEEISTVKGNLESMKYSHDAYHAGVTAEESKNYLTAIAEYSKVIAEDGFYSDAQVRLSQCKEAYVSAVLTQAKTKYEAYDIQGAIAEIGKGLLVMPENEELLQLQQTYQAAKAVELGEMEIFANIDAYGEQYDTYLTDNYGNTYEHSFSYVEGEIVYLVNYQYAYLSGTVACPKGLDTGATATLTVYGDGEKLKTFTSDILSSPMEFALPISDYERVSFVWYSEGDLWDDWGELATIFDGEWIPAGSILEEKAEAERAARREARLAAQAEEESEETKAAEGDTSFYKDGTAVAQNTFILPESEYQYLSESDLSNLTLKGLCYAKNEIYARHGRKFKSKELQEYFSKQSWYRPLYEASEETDAKMLSLMNSFELKNKDVLWSAEQKQGTYQLDQE